MNEKKGILLILGTAIISGVSIFVNSFAVQFSNPYIFTGMKNLFVGLLFISLIFLIKEHKQIKKINSRDWLLLALIGVIGGAIPFLLFFKGLSLTIGAKASFIHKSMFLYVGFLAIVFLKEKLNKSFIIGLLALLFGNILFLKIQPQSLAWGDLMIFGATLFWAIEIIVSKKVLKRISPKIVAFSRMFFGSVFIAAFLAITGQLTQVIELTSLQWQWIIITSVFLFGYVFTFYHGLKYIRASVATAILAIGAPITGLLTILFKEGQIFSYQQIMGILLIIFGIVLIVGLKKIVLKKRRLQIRSGDV